MIQFFIKIFLGDSLNSNNPNYRKKIGSFTSIVGILFNILLFLIKITIGLLSNTISIVADSFNNLADTATSAISFFSFKFSSKSPDKEHPFGHGRLEYIMAFIISFIIMVFSLELFKGSLKGILNPKVLDFNIWFFLFLFLTILIKVWLGFFNLAIGNKIASQTLLAAAKDSFNDVLVTSVTLIGVTVSYFTGWVIDGYLGMLVSLFVFYSGFSIARETFSLLLGEHIDPKIANDVYEKINSHSLVLGAHDLIIHSYGTNCLLASVHIEVSNSTSLEDAHTLADKIELDVSKFLDIHLTIHIDPVDILNEELNSIYKKIKHYIDSNNYDFTFSDLRMIAPNAQGGKDVIFNVSFPISTSESAKKDTSLDLQNFVLSLNSCYNCSVRITKNYTQQI